MRKKGVEMSLNVIIIAAIGLLILVILAFLVIKSVGDYQNTKQQDCSLKGGTCQTSCDPGREVIPNTLCSQNTNGKTTCCKVFPG